MMLFWSHCPYGERLVSSCVTVTVSHHDIQGGGLPDGVVTLIHLNESRTESKIKVFGFCQPDLFPLAPYHPSGYNTQPIASP